MDNSNTLSAGSVAAPAKERTTTSRIKSIFSGSVGNMVEWYDWYVYAAFSLYFAKAFFPKGDTTAQLLNTAAIFAVGFLMRPIGGWLMGLYADYKGRKAALMASVLLMCFGSLIIALSPGYETIGVGAPSPPSVAASRRRTLGAGNGGCVWPITATEKMTHALASARTRPLRRLLGCGFLGNCRSASFCIGTSLLRAGVVQAQ